MITEAELFIKAETMLLEVLGRIRPEHRSLVIPAVFDMPGADRPRPLPASSPSWWRTTPATTRGCPTCWPG